FQLDEKLRFKQLSARFANQDDGGGGRSTSREQIIYQHYSLTRCYGVSVHFYFCLAVFQRILRDFGPVRKLPAFANWHKSNSEFIGDSGCKNETARIDPNDFVNLLPATGLQKKID